MSVYDDLGYKTYNLSVNQLTPIILELLQIAPPNFLPTVEQFSLPETIIDQVILVIIDNFSLFEVITYQPEFLIKNIENLLLIETESEAHSLCGPMLYETFFCKKNASFNLVKKLQENDKSVRVIAREEDLPKITVDTSVSIAEQSDINVYVKGVKAVNRFDLLVLHFSDFDEMYTRYSMAPPMDVALKVMRRTDKWLKLLYQQSVKNTVLMVVGNNGEKPIDMTFEGRAAEWKRANLPIGFIKFPE
jgi:hypothetical protein